MNPKVKLCLGLYRALARAFPHEFQMLYGEDLERLGEDAAPEIWRRHGTFGLLRLLADIALRLPAEYLSELRGDVRFALRMLAKSPGFTAVGIISLTLGIGVCSLFFNVFTVAMFRPLVGVRDRATLAGLDTLVPYNYFESYREQRGVAAAAAFTDPVPFSVARDGSKATKPERMFGALVSPEYFSVLGTQPLKGRFFRADSEKPETAPVVVVSERFWRSHLSSDPQAVGRMLRVNNHLATILGVAPKDFLGVWPVLPADLFVPFTSGASIAPELAENAKPDACHVVIRLAHGVKPLAVEAALDVVTQRLDSEKPGLKKVHSERHVHLLSVDGIAPVPAAQRVVLFTFLAVLLGLVLSLACTNLTNLLLARSSHRRQEIAIRLSVGAGRFRLVRQLLTESLLLSLAGGVFGSGLVYWLMTMPPAAKFVTSADVDVRPNFTVLLFALAVSVIAGVGFGLAPALQITRTDVASMLKQGALTPLRGYRRFGLRNLLVVYQVAASLTLLLITGYIASGYGRAARIDPGFDTSDLTVYQLDPIHDGYSQAQIATLYEKLPERVSKLTTVRAVTLADAAPFGALAAVAPNAHFSASGPRGEVLRDAVRQRVGIEYFATLGVPLVRGREFSELDGHQTSGAIPVVLNQTAAHEFFGDDGPLGRSLRDDQHRYSVIGVTRDIKSGFMMAKPLLTIFVPLASRSLHVAPAQQGATVIVRGGAGLNTIADVRNTIASLDPDLTVFNVGRMNERLDQFNTIVRRASQIYGGIGIFGLILASIGLAGVTAYAVARRRKEIGIRMALGARSSQVLRLVMKEGAVMVAVGSALGFVGAFLVSRVLSSVTYQLNQLFDQGTHDRPLLIGAPLLLASIALLACYLPARRSARIDPLAALRDE